MPENSLVPSGLAGLVVFFLIAAIIERIVEVTTSHWQVKPDDKKGHAKKTLVTFVVGAVLGVTICCFGHLNIFIPLGIKAATDSSRQVLYYVLTGIAVGSGTQFLHEWLAIAVRTKEQLKRKMDEDRKDPCPEILKNEKKLPDTTSNGGDV